MIITRECSHYVLGGGGARSDKSQGGPEVGSGTIPSGAGAGGRPGGPGRKLLRPFAETEEDESETYIPEAADEETVFCLAEKGSK